MWQVGWEDVGDADGEMGREMHVGVVGSCWFGEARHGSQ